nr:TIM barrel protein [Chloroflexota bacterium]
EQLGPACRNVQWAADEAARSGITVLIEAVNTKDLAGYLLDTTAAATAFLQQVARPNVAYQYDVYHMQRMEGDIVSTLRAQMPHIGHIQIADSPGRGEPGTGEICFPYVLSEIEALGYAGYVGLEYNPTGGTEESLRWLPRELRGHDIQVDQLAL